MIDVIVVREVRCGESAYHIGDKVRLMMRKDCVGDQYYAGMITSISEGQIGLLLHGEVVVFLSKDIELIEKEGQA